MKATELNHVSFLNDGTEVIEATLITTTVPETLPTTGDGISGMNANQIFAPFSTLVVLGENLFAVYIADENGVFRQVISPAEDNAGNDESEDQDVDANEEQGEDDNNEVNNGEQNE